MVQYPVPSGMHRAYRSVRRTGPYRRTEIWPVQYGSVTVNFDLLQGRSRTGKPSGRYVPPVPSGTGWYGKP
ncbi:hypothetical protein GW17_00001292 [Ensete ventricosum]|nr:hypothetical protein GW17_00001292 [Ensete ventricosum]